jgi:type 1 fimbriae regulatory protein FimB/type 1 fimbriae regulatory protein FimE
MAKSHLKLVTPTEVNRTVAPTRRPYAKLRTRECLTSFRAGAGQAILQGNGIPWGGLEQHEILSTPG